MPRHYPAILALAFLIAFPSISRANLLVHDPTYNPVLRSTGIQPFPLTVDDDGAIYIVTGTSPSDNLVRINTDGTSNVLNGNVGFVIGVLSELEFGFDGDLFALAIDHVVQFDHTTWAANSFSANAGAWANGGLTFDPVRDTLFQISQEPFGLVSLDSNGVTTGVQTNILQGHALDLEPTGTLVSVFDSTISRVNPTDMSVSPIFDVSTISPSLISGRLAVHPIDGTIYFSAGFATPFLTDSYLYSIQPDGSGLNLIATLEDAGLGGMDVGPSGDGSGQLSLYISTPHSNTEIWELRSVDFAPIPDITHTDAPLTRIGTSSTLPPEIVIANIGDGNLSGLGPISNLNGTIDTGTDSRFVGGGTALSLQDHTSQSVPIVYTPSGHSTDTSVFEIDITLDAQLPDSVSVEVEGRGVGPTYESNPPAGGTVDFGPVNLDTAETEVLIIANSSTDPNGGDSTLTDLTLLSAVIAGPDAAEFALIGFVPGTVLSQMELINLLIEFSPQVGPGSKEATLTFFTDEGAPFGSPGLSFSYSLQGVGTPEPASSLGFAVVGGIGVLIWRRMRVRQA